MSEIKFGTDGWRAIIDKDFTDKNVTRASYAIAKYVLDNFGIEKKIIIGELEIDESSNSLRRGKESVTLPKKEFELLYMLLSYPNKVFTTSELLDEIWGYETDSDETTVRTHINRLRKRFDDYSEFKLVTIRGLGYRGEINNQ